MATLRATKDNPHPFQNVSLIVSCRDNDVRMDKDGKNVLGYFLDVQVDQSLKSAAKIKDGSKTADTNPHLASFKKKVEKADKPYEYTAHTLYYSKSQYDAMVAAAGKKATKTADGITCLGIEASLMQKEVEFKGESRGQQLFVNTAKPMGASKNPRFGPKVLERQAAVTAAAREHMAGARQAAAAEKAGRRLPDVPETENEGLENETPNF